MDRKVVIALSLLLAILVIVVSCVGLFTPNFYAAETLNWQVQSRGQDVVDLFLGPVLIITSLSFYKNWSSLQLIWAGVVLYLTYTFTLYCFDVHFNRLFILYCFSLGIGFYSFLYFIFSSFRMEVAVKIDSRLLIPIVGVYFISIAVLFYFLWLSEIVPAILQERVPRSITEAGLFTNGVHVLDLAVILPAIFITGVAILKGKNLGYIFVPVILSFFILMDITIATLTILMKDNGMTEGVTVAFIMGTLTLFSTIVLSVYLKKVRFDFKP